MSLPNQLRAFVGSLAIALSGLFLFAAWLAPKGQGDSATLVYAMYADVKDWDPAIAFSTEIEVLANLYETLVRYDPANPNEPIQPGLAKSWLVSNDGLTWQFRLRENVRFHDGTLLDAAAVKASIERTRELGGGAAHIWNSVEEIVVVDPSTVEFRLSQPAPLDLIASAQYGAYIYSPTAAAHGEEWFAAGQSAGTGPYRVTQWRPNAQVVLERFDDYWGGWEDGQFSRVLMTLVKESATQVQLLLAGEADFITAVPVEIVPALDRSEAVAVERFASWKNSQFLINASKPPTDNRLFRQALLHAWDYEAVVNEIYAGAATVPTGLIPPNIWGHDEDGSLPAFDLEEARRLLEASGVPEGDRKVEIAFIAASDAYRNAAQLFQRNLASIGVDLELNPGPWGVIWQQARNQRTAPHLISMTWWPTYPTPGDWLRGLYRTEDAALFNLSHFSSEEFDQLLDEAESLEGVNRDEAQELYRRAQRLLIEEAVGIFYADLRDRIPMRADITGFVPNPAYNAVFFYQLRRG